MNVHVLYFASLREALGCAGEEIALAGDVATVADLRAHIAARGGAWARLAQAKNLRAAINQSMTGFEAPIKSGDEIAFFPPVTGG
jgi:molybdopterin synthase sulfur carrier subunit